MAIEDKKLDIFKDRANDLVKFVGCCGRLQAAYKTSEHPLKYSTIGEKHQRCLAEGDFLF